MEEIAHTLASPVAAGLVRSAQKWPGAKTGIDNIGQKAIAVVRPEVHFGANDSAWVSIAHMKVALPPSLADIPAQAVRDDIKIALERLEAAARKHYGTRGFLGVERARKIQPESRVTQEAFLGRPKPPFVDVRKASKSRIAAALALRDFRASYDNAFRAWRAGDRSVEFPPGSYAVRIFHGATVGLRNPTPDP